MTTTAGCELCQSAGGDVIVETGKLRVVLVDEPNYPGFCRVIWSVHATEMTDLQIADRSHLMQAVCKVEEAVRRVMAPHKVNLASLGNMTPHLHWHVIPRFLDDAHFPTPVWGPALRESTPCALQSRIALVPALRNEIKTMFAL